MYSAEHACWRCWTKRSFFIHECSLAKFQYIAESAAVSPLLLEAKLSIKPVISLGPIQIGAWTGDQPSIKAKMQGNDVDTEYMQKGNTQGTVSSESLVNGRPVHERQEDPEELTSGDFQSAAGGISVSCPAQLISKSICCPHLKGGCRRCVSSVPAVRVGGRRSCAAEHCKCRQLRQERHHAQQHRRCHQGP